MGTNPQYIGKHEPGEYIKQYKLEQRLGRGSIGETWKALDEHRHMDVALKILYPDLLSNFIASSTTEGQILPTLNSPNIIKVYEVTMTRPSSVKEITPYIVMRYIEDPTLADYIHMTSQRGIFPSVNHIVYLFTCLGTAIDYAQQKGIVHGNLTPGNILLNKQNTTQFGWGEPMLSDLGLNQISGNAAMSSPLYMSPEQAKGFAPTNKSDIYSLGVILYEICTGIQPFRDESSVAVMMQHISSLPTPPSLINPNIPPALSRVILRAMEKDPTARYPIASLLANAIADACLLPKEKSLSPKETKKDEFVALPQPAKELPATSLNGSPPAPAPFPAARPFPAAQKPLSPHPSPHIFISHSHQDNDFGTKLVKDLRSEINGENAIWYDFLGGLRGGDQWWTTIKKELEARPIFVVILSPNALQSNWVMDEVNMAWRLKNEHPGKRIIPIVYRQCKVPIDLATLQVLRFTSTNTYREDLHKLLSALGSNPMNYKRERSS